MNPGHIQSVNPRAAEEIRLRAYFLWLQRGCPQGQHQEHWLEAEKLHYPGAGWAPETSHFSIRKTLAAHLSDPGHTYHFPASGHDDRLNVVAGEARQRIRGRHLSGSMRSAPRAQT